MTCFLKTRAGLFLGVALLSNTARADAIDDAARTCQAVDATGVASEPCSYSAFAIRISLDTTGSEAVKICKGMADEIRKVAAFPPGWKLYIYSPFSGDKTLAVCSLSWR
jgi:hypothetical protein